MILQVRIKVRDSGIPACETPAEVVIRVARNQFRTTFINLPAAVTISQYDTGSVYTVRARDSDPQVCKYPYSILLCVCDGTLKHQ